MKNYLWILLIGVVLAACYEDKGNYDYHEINQLTVDQIDSIYSRDQFDTLFIHPELKGTQYDEEDRFSYEWWINGEVVSQDKNLAYKILAPLGKNTCKLIITDKELETKVYNPFYLQVASSTASDAIVVLCNYKGKAELSFKRLDRNTPFQEVFYEKVNGEVLGRGALQMDQNYYFIDRLAGLFLLTNDGLITLDVNTMMKYGDINGAYVYDKALPKPELGTYSVDGFSIWRGSDTPFFNIRLIECNYFIVADGKLTWFQYLHSFSDDFYCRVVSSPYEGRLSSAVYPFWRSAGGGIGYDMSTNYVLFDETEGRFVFYNNQSKTISELEDIKAFPGYKLLYGGPLQEKNYSVAVMGDGNSNKLLYIKTADGGKLEILSEVDVPGEVMSNESDYAMRANTPHMLWVEGNKLYQYNVTEIAQSIVPSGSHVVASLDKLNLGYGPDAVITCMYLTRSQKSVILGISRYGHDTEGESDELKGDVVVLDADTWEVKEHYPAVSGYPVDIMVKYQENYRGGMDENGNMMDNI